MKRKLRKSLSVVLLIAILCSSIQLLNVYSFAKDLSGAKQLSFSQKYNGSINDSNEVDYYSFYVPTSGTIKIKYSHSGITYSDNSMSAFNSRLIIYDENGRLLDESGSYTSDATHIGYYETDIDINAGDYYYSIGRINGYNEGIYTLQISFTSANSTFNEFDNSPNNSYLTASKIAVGKKYYGHLAEFNDDLDFYTFSLSGKTTINVFFKSFFNGHLFIYNEDLKKVFSLDCYDSDTQYKTQTLEKGLYYVSVVKLNGYNTGSYFFNIDVVVNNPSGLKCTGRSTSAEKIAWNKVSGATGYQVQISNNGGSAWAKYYTTTSNAYTFKNLTAGGKYKFRVRAYKDVDGKRYYSPWSSALTSPTLPTGTSLTKLTPTKKAFTAQWKNGLEFA